ncbi:MAG: adventurous gliding motility protein CglE [Alphaproteobacteria bacterium]|nr:adventurous gliding motility protein CglE [Alphaproteobacteria bacterium]MCB9692800.1 adventurous gliding motility protein CglE [Alphaproteobacteria bacterium]
MQKILAVLAAFAFIGPTLVSDARADDQEDLDGRAKAKKSARSASEVRDIVRGTYVKSNVGSLAFLGPRASRGLLSPGTSLALTVGMDVVDKEKSSAAVEVFFHQGLNNGAKYFDARMVQAIQLGLHHQGDLHTFAGGVAGEYSTYLTKRLGLGVRAGGGVAYAPLLLDPEQYQLQVLNGPWGNVPSPVQNTPLPLILAGPTVEYYTKLSHFSIGIDASFVMYLGLDFGVDASGYMKYTF